MSSVGLKAPTSHCVFIMATSTICAIIYFISQASKTGVLKPPVSPSEGIYYSLLVIICFSKDAGIQSASGGPGRLSSGCQRNDNLHMNQPFPRLVIAHHGRRDTPLAW